MPDGRGWQKSRRRWATERKRGRGQLIPWADFAVHTSDPVLGLRGTNPLRGIKHLVKDAASPCADARRLLHRVFWLPVLAVAILGSIITGCAGCLEERRSCEMPRSRMPIREPHEAPTHWQEVRAAGAQHVLRGWQLQRHARLRGKAAEDRRPHHGQHHPAQLGGQELRVHRPLAARPDHPDRPPGP